MGSSRLVHARDIRATVAKEAPACAAPSRPCLGRPRMDDSLSRRERTRTLYKLCDNKTPDAHWLDDLIQARLLIEAGVNISAPQTEWTALHRAAHEGKTELCKLLIERNANVNEKSKTKGRDALFCAAHEGHNTTCYTLLMLGAEVNASAECSGWR